MHGGPDALRAAKKHQQALEESVVSVDKPTVEYHPEDFEQRLREKGLI